MDSKLDMAFALIKSLYSVQRSNVRVHGQTSDWFTIMKGVRQGCIRSPYLFNILAELLMRGWTHSRADSGSEGVSNNLRYADDIGMAASV